MTPERKRQKNQLEMELEELREEGRKLNALEQKVRAKREDFNQRAAQLEARQREWFAQAPLKAEPPKTRKRAPSPKHKSKLEDITKSEKFAQASPEVQELIKECLK